MIKIRSNPVADSRTCDVTKVDLQTLMEASLQHIGDVCQGMAFFVQYLMLAAQQHDYDKLTQINWFYDNFRTKFEKQDWWTNHRRIHRHHLNYPDGVPDDVNLLDVLEHIADCVMAGRARSGEIYPVLLSDELLQRALQNTVLLLNRHVIVSNDSDRPSV